MAAGPPAEQAVQRRGARAPSSCARIAVARRRARAASSCTASSQPRGRLAGRRGERDERRGRAGRRGLLGQQRDDARDRRRLAGARAAGDDGEAAQHRGRRGERAGRSSALAGEQPREPVARARRVVDVAGAARRASASRSAATSALLAPVAVEVEQRADEAQRPRVAPRPSPTRRARSRASALEPLARRPATAAPTRSTGLVGVDRRRSSRIVARSTQTWPSRGRAHGERGRERDRLVVLAARARRAAARRGRRRRASTPASLNVAQQAGRVARAADVERVDSSVDHAAAPRSSTSLQRLDQRRRRAPREHAARHAVDDRRVRPGHPAQEQVEHAGEVALGVVAGQPPAQVAVQRDRVEQRLQRVVRALHLRRERRRAGSARRSAPRRAREPVRLVVDDREAGRRRSRATRSMLPVR